MRRAIGGALVALAALAVWSPAAAAPSYADANQAYLTGDWQRAAEQYRALDEAGIVHPNLYYNLGNAEFRLGRLGPAVYNYERALRLDPDFEDARHNLELARDTVTARWDDRVQGAEGKPLWVRAATFLSPGRLAILFLVFNAFFFGGLLAARFLADGPLRIVVRVANVCTGAMGAALALMLVLQIWYLERTAVGIVLDDKVELREGRDLKSRQRWEVHAGLEVHIVERDGAWLRVELSNKTEGWVPRSSIGEL